ncbi:VanW family protein [Candidatus Uhrbacteria bacterium]|nr:VanW family protein [Candidatus Uhrbacteria bacterium]
MDRPTTWLKNIPSTTRRFVGLAVFATLLIGIPFLDAIATKGLIYPGVSVAGVELGGQTAEEARAALKRATAQYLNEAFPFVAEELRAALPLPSFLVFDVEETVRRAQTLGATGSFFERAQDRVKLRTSGMSIDPVFIVDETVLNDLLKQAFKLREAQSQNAQFVFAFDKKTPAITIKPEEAGTAIDLSAARRELDARAVALRRDPINLTLAQRSATILATDLEPLQSAVEAIFSRPIPEIKLKEKHWTIPKETLALWITAKKSGNSVALALEENLIAKWLDGLAKEIERPPEDAVFELAPDEKRVTKFSLGVPGIGLPRKENAAAIARAILQNEPAYLTVNETPPKVLNPQGAELAEKYGIKELVGSGTTDFKGSPPNRVKNIKRGADLLNGTLIAAGEEFSLLDHLRPFTLENGYLPELVIKAAEGRTTPEIGGGLCQIGTTMFRTVLNAGLPITARRNHSYRVSYYEPPVGMDATIYDPAPDFKFLNDTGSWLLLTAYVDVKAMRITFELWGTKDQRAVTVSEPKISNLRKPPEKKIIETTDLPPGKVKCTEKAHVGSDAEFTYTVTYPDGRVEENVFKSRYRPWQEVCLVGVEKKAETAEAPVILPSPDATTVPSADTLGVIGDSEIAPPNQSQN